MIFQPDCKLVQSKEVTMQTNDAERVFGSDNYNMASKQGKIHIELEKYCMDV